MQCGPLVSWSRPLPCNAAHVRVRSALEGTFHPCQMVATPTLSVSLPPPCRRTAFRSALRAARRGWCREPTSSLQSGACCRSLRTSRQACAAAGQFEPCCAGITLWRAGIFCGGCAPPQCPPLQQYALEWGAAAPGWPGCECPRPHELNLRTCTVQPEEVTEEHRRDGFETASADRIFESTTLAAEQLQ